MLRSPTAFSFWTVLGAIEREQGKTTEAIGYYKQMTALGGDFALRGYQSQVDTYREAHQQHEATGVAEDAAKAMPQDRGVQLMFAGQLADTGKVEEGFALARRQMKNTPEDREVYLALAQMGRSTEAMAGRRDPARQGNGTGNQTGREAEYLLPSRNPL